MGKSITIPTRSIWSLLVAIALIGFTYIQMIGYIIPGFETIKEITKETTTIKDSGLIWVPIISYLLISAVILMVVRIFKELKPYKEKGLILGLIGGFMVGFIGGFMVGFIMGLVGFIGGFIAGFILGFILGLILGLIGGFMVGLIMGLVGFIEELK